MRNLRGKVIWLVIFLFIFNLVPYTGGSRVEASDDINVISSTEISVTTAKAWASSKGATETFIKLADLYWKYSSEHGNVNPAVAYVQAAKETGYGKFGGVLDESYHNPCGLKTSQGGSDSDPNAHMKFSSWDEGVQAHLDHLALYAGASGYPRSNTYDPRHFSSICGTAKTVQALGGKWAPSATYGTEIVNMYNTVLSMETTAKSITVIDTPTNGFTTGLDNLTVSGWALNSKGVSKINVYLDGKLQTTAQMGISRPDVAAVYPSYQNSNSGYSASISLKGVSDGTKTIKVEQVGKDNSVDSVEVKINITKHKPIQVIDSPVSNATVTGNKLMVSGWSLNTVPISKINIYVDGQLKATTNTNISRPDVKAVYPQYTSAANSGYSAEVDITNVSGGNRIIKVEQVASDGSTHVTETRVNINKPAPIQVIDSPVNGAVISGNSLTVSGWSLNNNGIKSIKIYLDGELKATTNIGISRPDVKAAYPQYANTANSGYSATFDITNVSGGNRTLKVEQVASDGSIHTTETKVNINKPAPIQVIDSPTNGAVISGNSLTVSGWSLNNDGIKSIKIYLDGQLKATTNIGISRPDVKAAYPQYINTANSGYSATFDITDIASGQKKLKVEQVASSGKISTNEITVNIKKLSPITVIDNPSNGMKVTSKQITVSGWALNPAGVKEVKVYVNNTEMTSASLGISRPDVASVYPQYSNSNSGYTAYININAIKPGNNTVTVKQIGKDGTEDSVSTTINISKKTPITVLDVPSSESIETSDSIRIAGWALNESGVKQVNVYIDGLKVSSPAIDIARSDVIAAYPGYQTSNVCGFAATVDLSSLTKGQHAIVLEAIGYDGTVGKVTSNFYYKEKPSKLIVLDPGHNNGGDDGAYATVNGVTYSETELNGIIALKTKAALESKGYRVTLTRNPLIAEYYSLNESLARRVDIANSLNADLFISIHQNKFDLESANGTEVYYSTNNADAGYSGPSDKSYKINVSKQLASTISSNISNAAGFRNRGDKDGNLFVCRNTSMPAVLIECGFISNQNDVSKLNNSTVQQTIAEAIASGVKTVIG